METDGFILDTDDLVDYIGKKTCIHKEIIETVLKYEQQYMIERGIVEIQEIN